MKTTLLTALLTFAVLNSVNAKAAEAAHGSVSVIAIVKVQPGAEQAFKAAAMQMLKATLMEPGNISYDFDQAIEDPLEFATSEKWQSEAAIEKHMTSAHMQEFFKAVGGLFAPGYPQIRTYKTLGQQ